MQSIMRGKWTRWVVLAFVCYLGSYAILWQDRWETMYIMTVDRGCISKTREAPALRFAWVARVGLRTPVTVLYWPVNALRTARSEWR